MSVMFYQQQKFCLSIYIMTIWVYLTLTIVFLAFNLSISVLNIIPSILLLCDQLQFVTPEADFPVLKRHKRTVWVFVWACMCLCVFEWGVSHSLIDWCWCQYRCLSQSLDQSRFPSQWGVQWEVEWLRHWSQEVAGLNPSLGSHLLSLPLSLKVVHYSPRDETQTRSGVLQIVPARRPGFF